MSRFSVKRGFFALLLLLFVLVAAGCGGGDGGSTAVPAPNPSSTQVGTIVVNQVLLRSVPRAVTHTRFTGFNAQGARQYGPVTVAKASRVVLSDVPISTTRLQIEHLAEDTVVGLGTVSVTVLPGQTTTITDPPFNDVQVVLSALEIDPPNPRSAKGLSVQLAALGTLTDDSQLDQTTSVTWTSSNPSVAQIDTAGSLRCLNTGTCVITATLGSVSAQTTVTVTAAVITSITVDPPAPSTPAGTSVSFTSTANLSDGTTQDATRSVTWTSSEPSVATIGTTGLATGVNPGQTTIGATLNGFSASTTLDVSTAIVGLRVDPPVILYGPGGTREFRVYAQLADDTEVEVTDRCELSISSSQASLELPQQAGDPARVTLESNVTLASTIALDASLYSLEASSEIRVNRLVFSSLIFDDRVLAFQASSDGVLTQVGEIDSDPAPGGLAVSQDGLYLYVSNLNSPSGVSTYEIAADGTLTFLSKVGSAGCDELVIHPSGKYMYGGTRYTILQAYSLSPDGSVELLESELGGEQTYNLDVSPDGEYLYSVAINSSLLWTHRVEEDGTLTLVDSQATPVVNPYDVSVSSDGKTLVVTLASDNSIATYDLSAGEIPQLIENFRPGASMAALVFDPLGRFAVGSGNFYSTFAVDPLDLTQVLSSTAWGPTPTSPWQMKLDSLGELLFTTSPGSMKVGSAKISGDGTLSNLSVFDTSGGTGNSLLQPRGLAVTP